MTPNRHCDSLTFVEAPLANKSSKSSKADQNQLKNQGTTKHKQASTPTTKYQKQQHLPSKPLFGKVLNHKDHKEMNMDPGLQQLQGSAQRANPMVKEVDAINLSGRLTSGQALPTARGALKRTRAQIPTRVVPMLRRQRTTLILG